MLCIPMPLPDAFDIGSLKPYNSCHLIHGQAFYIKTTKGYCLPTAYYLHNTTHFKRFDLHGKPFFFA